MDNQMIDNFNQIVQQKFYLASKGESQFFANKGPVHARSVISTMIDYTRSNLLIYTGCLNSYVYDAQSLLNLADRLEVGMVKIIHDPITLSNEPSELRALAAPTNRNPVLVKALNQNIWNLIKNDIKHFAISDSINIRSEENHEHFTASVFLNQQEIATNQVKVFEAMWQAS